MSAGSPPPEQPADLRQPPVDPARVSLRPVAAGDEPLLRRIYAGTRADELALVPWSEEQKQAFVDMQFRAQTQFYAEHFPDTERLVVLCDGAAAGRLYLDRQPEEIRIIDIALLPEHRGSGVGTHLLRRVLAEAAAARLPVRIHVERVNPALRLYQRLGFTIAGDAGVYLLMEWRPGPA